MLTFVIMLFMCEEFLILELYSKFKVNTNFLPTLKYTAVSAPRKIMQNIFLFNTSCKYVFARTF